MPDFDIVVIGGGHNGLTAAAYFAALGFSTVVLERNKKLGGGVVTDEVMPGVHMDLHSLVHVNIMANPMIKNDELGLQSKFGLKYIRQDLQTASAWLDGSYLMFYKDLEKTVKSISRFNVRDAERYKKMVHWALPLLEGTLDGGFDTTPTPIAKFLEELELSAEGRDMLSLMFCNAIDLISEFGIEDPRLQAYLVKTAMDWFHGDPRREGTGVLMLLELITLHKYGQGIPVGGSGKLSEALEASIRDNGGQLYTNSGVDQIIVEDGVASGARLQDGRVIKAKKAVVANLNVKQIPLLCGEDVLDQHYRSQVNRIVHGYSSGQVEWVLSDFPKFSANPDLMKCYFVRMAESVEEVLKLSDSVGRGEPQWQYPNVFVHTLLDGSRAPKGIHTLNMWIFNPYKLREGGAEAWDDVKDEIAKKAYENLGRYCPNLSENIVLRRHFQSPLDYVRWDPSMINGDINHIAETFYQNGSMRPLPGYGDFGTPIRGLYLCGSSTNTGGGVTGQARAAAKAVVTYLGFDFHQLMSVARSAGRIPN